MFPRHLAFSTLIFQTLRPANDSNSSLPVIFSPLFLGHPLPGQTEFCHYRNCNTSLFSIPCISLFGHYLPALLLTPSHSPAICARPNLQFTYHLFRASYSNVLFAPNPQKIHSRSSQLLPACPLTSMARLLLWISQQPCPQPWARPTFPTPHQELSSRTWRESTWPHWPVPLWMTWPQSPGRALRWVLPDLAVFPCPVTLPLPDDHQYNIFFSLQLPLPRPPYSLIHLPEKKQKIQKKTPLKFH